MKKLIALAGVLSLAACGSNADAPTEAGADDIAADAAVIPATAAGSYTTTTADGTAVAMTLNADGSYTVTEAGETVESGSWEDNIRGTCLMAEGGEGENCLNIVPGDDGSVSVTGSDGQTMVMTHAG